MQMQLTALVGERVVGEDFQEASGAGAQRAGREEGRNEGRKGTEAQGTEVTGRTAAFTLSGEESPGRFLAEERGDLT